MVHPIITSHTLDWLRVVCDVPPKSSDSNDVIRWKAAQRNIYIQAKALYDNQNKSSGNAAEKLGYNIKSDT